MFFTEFCQKLCVGVCQAGRSLISIVLPMAVSAIAASAAAAVIPFSGSSVLTSALTSVSILPLGLPLSELLWRKEAQAHALLFLVNLNDPDFNHVTYRQDCGRILYSLAAHAGDVNQSIRMKADVHKGAEGNYIPHGTVKLVSYLQVVDLQDVALQKCSVKLVSVVPERGADSIFDVF